MKLLRQVGALSSSMAVAAVINVSALPFLARAYTPDDFARYGFVVAVVSILSVVSNARMDQAVLVSKDEELAGVIGSGLLVSFAFCALVYAISVILGHKENALYFSIATLSNSLFQIVYASFMFRDKLKQCAILNVLRTGILVAAQIACIFLFSKPSLLYGLLVQNLCFIGLGLVIHGVKIRNFSFAVLKRNSDFLVHNTPHALMNAFSHNVPYFLIVTFLGAKTAGYYMLIDRVMKTPIRFFSQVVRQLFIKRFTMRKNQIKSAIEALKVSSAMFLISAPFFVGVYFVPDSWVEYLIGADWVGIQRIGLFLGIGYLFTFSNPPTTAFIISLRRASVMLKAQSIELPVKFIAFFVIYYFSKSDLAVLCVSVSLCIYNAMLWAYVKRCSRASSLVQ